MSQRLVIVGGGVIGLCTAYYAAQKGFKVTVLEDAKGHPGCSFGNAGMIVPSHFIPLAAPGMVGMGLRMLFNPAGPFAIRPSLSPSLLKWGWLFLRSANQAHVERSAVPLRDLHLLSRKLYEELAEAGGNSFALEKRGLLGICKTQHALDEEALVAEKANQLGLHARILDRKQLQEADPGITMDAAGAVHFEEDCHLIPGKLLEWLRENASVQEATVTGWTLENGKLKAAQTDQGEIEADEFVLAAGAWSPEVAQGLHLKLPMQAGKGYSVTLANPRQLPQICSLLTEARVAITPMGGSLRVGGTMELTGNDLSVNRRRLGGIFKAVPQYFPEFKESDFEGLPVWSGLRPCSPDGLPYLGRSRRVPNLVVATGHSMMGISLGPATGKLVSEILAGEKTTITIDTFNPNRFDLND